MKSMRTTFFILFFFLSVPLIISSCKDSSTGADDGNGDDPGKVDPETIELSGTISADSTLANIFTDPSIPDYLVVGDVDIAAELTIDPGVVIYVQEDRGISVTGSGILKADGTADSLIVITGEGQSANGFWRGINVHSSSVENSISYAEISYAGSKSAGTYFDASAIMVDRAKISLSNTTISNSGGYGIQTRRDGSEFPMSNMEFKENDLDHANVHTSQIGYFDNGSTFDGGHVAIFGGGTDANTTISALNGAAYKVKSSIDFEHDIVIEEGARFEFTSDARLNIASGSSIVAQGTPGNEIVFTGTSAAPGAWKGIFVSSSSVDNIFEHVDISYGGSSEIATYFGKTNMAIDRAKVTLKNVKFSGSAGYGIQTRRNGSTFSVESSTFSDNANSDMRIHPTQAGFIDNQTDFNGGDVEVYKGDTEGTGSATWSNLNNGVFYFSETVTIDNEVRIEKGAEFEMGSDVSLVVSSSTKGGPSVIKAIGTASEPILFTGRSKAKGAWAGILISSGSIENEMDYVKIEYGGGKDLATYMDAGNLGVYNEGALTLTNSSIENSASYGIIVRTGRNAVLTKQNISYSGNTNLDFYTY